MEFPPGLHAAESGNEIEHEVGRALMLLRLSTMLTGRTGVRLCTAETYAAVLKARNTTIVGEYKSLGCSSDLAPLAHHALAFMCEGTVRDRNGTTMLAAQALHNAATTPVTLPEKEGLAPINETDGILDMLCFAVRNLSLLMNTANISAAMSVEALLGTEAAFAADR
jgi:histidine ammonia-lyase